MDKRQFKRIIAKALLITVVTAAICCSVVPQAAAASSPDQLARPADGMQAVRDEGTAAALHTGKLLLGRADTLVQQTIGPAGGHIAVDIPASYLNGLSIDIPADAYSGETTFRVSERQVTGHMFGAVFNAISPLISVENGAEYADRLMTVTVPVKVPAGHFAMGFYYIEKTGELESISLLSIKDNSVSLAVTNFANPFIICSIPEADLQSAVTSGFKPGVDDWAFANYGSYIAPWGQCSGQTLAALWYYHDRPEGQAQGLYGRSVRSADVAAPGIWKGDVSGYKLSSLVQVEYQGKIRQGERMQQFFSDLDRLDDKYVMYSFKYSMLMTGAPQYVEAWNFKQNTGHALIVYGVDADGTLLTADPNFPGDCGRRIEFDGSRFIPYNSAANAAGGQKGTAYDSIIYCVNTSMLPYNEIAESWNRLLQGDEGDGLFPNYSLAVYDDNGGLRQVLSGGDGYTIYGKTVKLGINAQGKDLNMTVYRDGSWAAAAGGKLELKPGVNHIGIAIWGNPVNSKGVSMMKWVDFKYYDIICAES